MQSLSRLQVRKDQKGPKSEDKTTRISLPDKSMEDAREIYKASRVQSAADHGCRRTEQDQKKHLPQQVKKQAVTPLSLKINQSIKLNQLVDSSLGRQAAAHRKEDLPDEAHQQPGQHHLSSEKQQDTEYHQLVEKLII